MAKKEFKRLSFAERLANPDVIKRHKVERTDYKVAVEEQEVVNGRIVRAIKYKNIDVNEYLSQFKVTDFCLENLQACGAIANLKPVSLDGGVINAIDSVVAGFEKLDSIEIDE